MPPPEHKKSRDAEKTAPRLKSVTLHAIDTASNLCDLAALYRFVTAEHSLNSLLMPFEVDEGRLLFANTVDKFVDQADPLVEIGVLYRIAVVRSAIMIDVGSKTIASQHSLLSDDRNIDLHALRETLPTRARHLDLLFKPAPGRIEKEGRSILHLADSHKHILDLEAIAKIGRNLGVDVIKRTSGKMANQIEYVRMIAQCATLAPAIARFEVLHFAKARLRIALPRKRPHRRKSDIGGLNRFDFPDGSVCNKLLKSEAKRS